MPGLTVNRLFVSGVNPSSDQGEYLISYITGASWSRRPAPGMLQ